MSFTDFFKEENGNFSSTRLNSFLLVCVVCILSLIVGYMGLHMMWFPLWANFIPIAPSTSIIDAITWLICGLLGFAVGSKVWQKKYETGASEFSKDEEKKDEVKNG